MKAGLTPDDKSVSTCLARPVHSSHAAVNLQQCRVISFRLAPFKNFKSRTPEANRQEFSTTTHPLLLVTLILLKVGNTYYQQSQF
jgi:hypothetical protein